MSEIKNTGRARTITMIILLLMAIGMGYDQLKENEKSSPPPSAEISED